MNENFNSRESKYQLDERITIVTPGVEHNLSRFDSIVNTKKSYCYLAIPGVNGIYYRRYLCMSCEKCKLLKFLECTNEYCGPWKFHAFNVNQKTLEKLFKDAISPFLTVIRGQKKNNKLLKML